MVSRDFATSWPVTALCIVDPPHVIIGIETSFILLILPLIIQTCYISHFCLMFMPNVKF